MSIVAAILVLSFLIIVHEIGHFAAAKLLGVRVLEFSLFMGPRLLSIKRGETRYSLKLIPVGGSCLMEGEDSASEDDRALGNKPKWVRAAIFAAGPFMNLAIAFIMILILNMYLGYATNEVSYVADHSPAASAAPVPIAVGDTLVSYGGKRVNVPTEVFIYMHDTKGATVDVTFRRGGELMKTVIEPDFTPGRRYILGFNAAQASGPDWNLVERVTEGDPADELGIEPGDRILRIDGKTPADLDGLRAALAESEGGELEITWIKPDGTPASGRVAPKLINDQDSYSIGIGYGAADSPGIFGSMRYAYYNAVSYSKMVLYSLKWMVTGAIGLNQVSGPVGIVAEIGAGVDEVSRGPNRVQVMISYLLNLSALIGINLGLFNLIPFPPLDGSKLLLLGVEAIRRKDIPPERQVAITMFGFAVLILIMVLTLFNDIIKLVNR
ncbi:MAG: RIP metalloprotease RseP [Oscillospiraceae bacterium]|nr:RIP metalloprotease RseP [Oscillospiraceae bacterium]